MLLHRSEHCVAQDRLGQHQAGEAHHRDAAVDQLSVAGELRNTTPFRCALAWHTLPSAHKL